MNPDGNERLTAAVGVLLLAPVVVEVATILLGVHTFMSWHVFVGLALIPVVVLKLATTGWRFLRYYTGDRAYVAHGPPRTAMRLLAPLFVVATVVLFGSGVAMGFLHGHSLQIARRLHGPASVIWLLLLGVHVLVYLGRALRSTADDVLPEDRRRPSPGRLPASTAWRRQSSAGSFWAPRSFPPSTGGSASGTTTTTGETVSPLRGTGRSRTRTASGRSSRPPAAPSPSRRSGRAASSRRA